MSTAESASSNALPVVEAFARRLAERDVPPPPNPHRYERAHIEERLGRAALRRLGGQHPRRVRALGRLLYGLVEHPRLTTAALAELTGLHPDAAGRLVRELLADGLLTRTRNSWSFEYALSRAGEDWALPIVQDEAPKGT